MEKITAPFTLEQVENINAYQQRDDVHPFTCANRDHHTTEAVLKATEQGFVCPECDYTQNWAWDMMTQKKWRE